MNRQRHLHSCDQLHPSRRATVDRIGFLWTLTLEDRCSLKLRSLGEDTTSDESEEDDDDDCGMDPYDDVENSLLKDDFTSVKKEDGE